MWANCAAANITGSVGLPVVDAYGETSICPSVDDVKARMLSMGNALAIMEEATDADVARCPQVILSSTAAPVKVAGHAIRERLKQGASVGAQTSIKAPTGTTTTAQ